MIVTLCGSTRFKREYERVNRELTLQGHVVISVGLFGQEVGQDKGLELLTTEQKKLLDEVHLQKIRMSDAIFVVNVGLYVGHSTSLEIEYAEGLGKVVFYLERPKDIPCIVYRFGELKAYSKPIIEAFMKEVEHEDDYERSAN